MRITAVIDRVLGRTRLDIVDGSVACPIRAGRLDVEACSPCPYRFRTDVDRHGDGVVVCRAGTLSGSDATITPPM
jgi:hypothetical protein